MSITRRGEFVGHRSQRPEVRSSGNQRKRLDAKLEARPHAPALEVDLCRWEDFNFSKAGHRALGIQKIRNPEIPGFPYKKSCTHLSQ